MPKELIVAEVTKIWTGRRDHGEAIARMETLGGRFEHVLAVNAQRGYRLLSWRMVSCVTGRAEVTETIIAIFEREDMAIPLAGLAAYTDADRLGNT